MARFTDAAHLGVNFLALLPDAAAALSKQDDSTANPSPDRPPQLAPRLLACPSPFSSAAMSHKGKNSARSSKAKKPAKSGAESKSEDVLQAVVSPPRSH
ncbi:hypothetical protein OCS_06404 [Ophiocordyceps sinensis CO18]|uniref:Uncharacterized protein n=1 Tax=Ophiocordyceps sinensis (strain Co18 / CGMCC 3.14243) TaxID=911162 RepID=T5A5L1_OPHSC|nr:hypothetical protein OCS_06404 [Ophiocordyceps sinensis CO18]